MTGFDPHRRAALQRMAALAAAGFARAGRVPAGLAPALLTLGPARAADMVVGVVYIGPRDDWGWNQSFAEAAAALATLPGVRVAEAGHLPESTNYASGRDDAETRAYAAAIEGLVAEGARLVISTSFDDDPFLAAAAVLHPEVAFRQARALGGGPGPPNLGGQNALIDRGHYVNGVAAGLSTVTNSLGFVAGMPFAPVLLDVNSFLLGARSTNPAATVRVIFTGAWEGETHDAAAANALVDAGCDVIGCHLDAPRVVIETAEERGAKTCGHAVDQGRLAPRGYVTGADYHWAGMFAGFVETLGRGGALPAFLTGGYDRDYVRSSPFGAGATPAAIAAAEVAIRAMRRGDAVFVGPLRDNTGREVVPPGTTYGPYAEALQRTDYLLEGVIGTTG